MPTDQNIENTRLLNELAAARFMKIQALKIAALEQLLAKHALKIYREYERTFNELRDAD
jgi:hypothetical protein